MTYRRSEDFANETGPTLRLLRGMIRRVAVTLTSAVKWQVLGQRGGSGGDETFDVEPFTGIGFYGRPPSSGKPEAVTAAVGGAKTTVIVATRDEATRKTGAGDLAEGETCVYNDKARLIVKADGTVEIRLHGGVAIALATLADVAKIGSAIAGATIAAGDGGATFKATIGAGLASSLHGMTGTDTWPVGTTVLKAQ